MANKRQIDGKFITVYTDIHITPVDMIKSALESRGIICLIKGYDRTRPNLSFGTGIELQVQKKDRNKAKEIIKKIKTEGLYNNSYGNQ